MTRRSSSQDLSDLMKTSVCWHSKQLRKVLKRVLVTICNKNQTGSSKDLGSNQSILGRGGAGRRGACLLLKCPELLSEMVLQGSTWADSTYFIHLTFIYIIDPALLRQRVEKLRIPVCEPDFQGNHISHISPLFLYCYFHRPILVRRLLLLTMTFWWWNRLWWPF